MVVVKAVGRELTRSQIIPVVCSLCIQDCSLCLWTLVFWQMLFEHLVDHLVGFSPSEDHFSMAKVCLCWTVVVNVVLNKQQISHLWQTLHVSCSIANASPIQLSKNLSSTMEWWICMNSICQQTFPLHVQPSFCHAVPLIFVDKSTVLLRIVTQVFISSPSS